MWLTVLSFFTVSLKFFFKILWKILFTLFNKEIEGEDTEV